MDVLATAEASALRLPEGSDAKRRVDRLPFTLTWPFLASLALYIIGLIVGLELSLNAFPSVKNDGVQYDAAPVESIYLSARAYRGKETAPTRSYYGGHPPFPTSGPHGMKPGDTRRQWRRANTTGNIGTSVGGISSASAQPTATSSRQGALRLEPLQFGNRWFYPTSNLTRSLNLSTSSPSLVPRRPPEESYGTLGRPQKITIAYSVPSKPPPEAENDPSMAHLDFSSRLLAYFSEATKYLEVFTVSRPQQWDAFSIDQDAQELCVIQCNGPFIAVGSESCLFLWDPDYFLDGAGWARLGRPVPISESEYLSGTQCPTATPMPNPSNNAGPGSVAFDTVVEVVETHDGVATTSWKPTRIIMATPFETGVARSGSVVATTRTLRGKDGRPLSTTEGSVTVAPVTLTLTGAGGRPTKTITTAVPLYPANAPGRLRPGNGSRPDDGASAQVGYMHGLGGGEYFLGTFGPVLLAAPLGIAAQALAAQTRAQLPFLALAAPGGARPADSLFLRARGLRGLTAGWRVLHAGAGPAGVLADALAAAAALVVALAGETVAVRAYGACAPDDGRACSRNIAVHARASRVVEAALALLLVLVALLAAAATRLRGRTRAAAPLSIVGLAGLLGDGETRRALATAGDADSGQVRARDLIDALEDRKFSLSRQGKGRAGFIITSRKEPPGSRPHLQTVVSRARQRYLSPLHSAMSAAAGPRSATQDPAPKTRCHPHARPVSSGVFLVVLCGFTGLILYYELTQEKSNFEHWMDTQTFGVRFLFGGTGVLISWFWDSRFTRVSTLEPYHRLALRPQPAQGSILLSPATSPLVGIVKSLIQGSFAVASVALMAILGKFTPILFSNIPFNPIQTFDTHQRCTWMAIGILALMIIVLLVNLVFVKYPRLPVDPETLGGGLFYLCDSQMTEELADESGTTESEVSRLGLLGRKKYYRLGQLTGVSGRRRVGVDFAEDGDLT